MTGLETVPLPRSPMYMVRRIAGATLAAFLTMGGVAEQPQGVGFDTIEWKTADSDAVVLAKVALVDGSTLRMLLTLNCDADEVVGFSRDGATLCVLVPAGSQATIFSSATGESLRQLTLGETTK